MRKLFMFILIILPAFFGYQQIYSQAKKAPVKKATVAAKLKVPVKTKTTIVSKPKLPVKSKPAATAKKNTPVKPVNKASVSLPNNQVNNSEITNVTLTSRELEMINEINQVRLNPAKYCTYVEEYLLKYDADSEVKAAAQELVSILKKLKPLHPLTLNPVMYNDAKQYGLLMAKKNVFEHSSLPYAENLSLGHKNIRDAIIDLLIDDGIPDRGHRKNLLSEKVKHVAVYELPGKIQDIGYCYIQQFK